MYVYVHVYVYVYVYVYVHVHVYVYVCCRSRLMSLETIATLPAIEIQFPYIDFKTPDYVGYTTAHNTKLIHKSLYEKTI